MKIAISFQRVDPHRGGAETYVVDLASGLLRRGHDVTLYASAWSESALPAGLRVAAIPPRGATRAARTWNFAVDSERLLRDIKADCVVGLINTWCQDVLIPQGGIHPASLEHNARRFAPGWRRAAYRLLKRTNPKAMMYRAIERRQYDPRRPTRYVAPSRFVAGHLERFYRVAPERIDVIHNAIDANRLGAPGPGARARIREQFGLGPNDLVGLFVGHNFALKGLGPLLDTLGRRAREGKAPIRLLVCGGGRARPWRAAIERMQLRDHVRLAGFVPDVRACYEAADFFVSPTYYDPCSLVVFEALACGLPVITTACNGAGEVIRPGKEGFVIPRPDDRHALAMALDVMAEASKRAAMATHARATGRLQGFDRHLNKLETIFAAVAARKAAGRRRAITFALGHVNTFWRTDRDEGHLAGGGKGDSAPALYGRPPQAADAAGRPRPDADH